MSPATSWTENTGTAPAWFESVPTSTTVSGFALFGMPIPIIHGLAFASGDATWSENSVSAASYTEKSQSAQSWTERSM